MQKSNLILKDTLFLVQHLIEIYKLDTKSVEMHMKYDVIFITIDSMFRTVPVCDSCPTTSTY